MGPTKKFISWLTAVALIAAMVMVSASFATAASKPPKTQTWNIYQDKLGVYSCTSASPKGQTFIVGSFANQAACTVVLTTPPTISYALTPSTPTGLNDWYTGDVSLVWNVAYPTPNKVSITGAVNQNITADRPATNYSGSVTAIGGNAGPVTVTIKRDATPPVITWDSLISDGDSFFVGSVPAEPAVTATDTMSGLNTVTLTGYSAAVGAHSLVATATDNAGNVTTEQWGYTVTLRPAAVVDPTATDQTWNGSDYVTGGITIPTVVGIDYFIAGAAVAGGFNALAPGTYAVTAQTQPDYELTGYPVGGWNLTIAPAIIPVTATVPTAVDQTWDGTAYVSGGIDIPAVTGVDYSIGGAVVASGFNDLVPNTYSVSAAAKAGYKLDAYTGPWSLTINAAIIPVTATVPTAVDQTWDGTALVSGGIQIPNVAGVDYFVEGASAAAGLNNMDPGTYPVSAEAQAGYALQAYDGPWSLTINAGTIPDTPVTPEKPTVKNESANGTLDGGITIPAVTGVDYFIDTNAVSAGFNALAVGSYVVTVAAQQGYVFENDASPWTLVVGKDAPPKVIQFVGAASAGSSYTAANTVNLPAGWQPGDMAIVMASNATTASPPVVPAGWTAVPGAAPSISTAPYAVSRVGYRVLQAGDTSTGVWTNTKDIVVVVYRNVASIGAVTSSGLSFTASAPYKVIPLPALSFQVTNGSSWFVGLGYINAAQGPYGVAKTMTAAGTVNRTSGTVGPRLGVIDSNGGVTGWAGAQPIISLPPMTAATNGVSLELRVAP